jgi:hypothetical protein
MASARITLTVSFEYYSTAPKLDRRALKRFTTESIAQGSVTLWDAHARAEVEPGGRVVEWDLDAGEEER